MRVDINTGMGTSGMDKFSSKVHRVHTGMELEGKLLISLRIETQFLEKLQSVSVVCVVLITKASSLAAQPIGPNK